MFRNFNQFANRICVIDPQGRHFSYTEIMASGRAALADLAPAKQLLFIEGRNTPGFVSAYCAALDAGHLVHVFDPDRAQAIQPLIESYSPDALVLTDGEVARLAPVPRNPEPLLIEDDLALLLATSGTTGSRKLVKITEGNIAANTAAIISYLGMTGEDRGITTLKPYYSYGLTVINTHLTAGASLVLSNASVQDSIFWAQATQHGITNFAGVPHSYELLKRMDSRLAALDRLRFATQAGGRLAPDLVRHFARLARQGGWRFFVMYGQTEASPRISYLPPEQAEQFPDAIGLPIPGGRMWLTDDMGHVITDDGVEGELNYAGPNVMAGYCQSAIDLGSGDRPASLRTGDMARRLPNGLYVLAGRKSRFVKPFGRRLNLDDIEAMLASEGIEAAAMASGETLMLFVAGNGATEIALAERLAQHTRLPVSAFDVRPIERIPRLGNDKIDRMALQRAIEAVHGTPPAAAQSPSAVLRAVWREFSAIMMGHSGMATSVADIFRATFRHAEVNKTQSFVSLGGDSMSAVTVHLQLEDLIGTLPPDWHERSIAELELMKGSALG